jgi:hypothetical protein
MRRIRAVLATAVLIVAMLAGCRFIVPADGSQAPLPGSSEAPAENSSGFPFPAESGAPRLSPSLEVPPPVD